MLLQTLSFFFSPHFLVVCTPNKQKSSQITLALFSHLNYYWFLLTQITPLCWAVCTLKEYMPFGERKPWSLNVFILYLIYPYSLVLDQKRSEHSHPCFPEVHVADTQLAESSSASKSYLNHELRLMASNCTAHKIHSQGPLPIHKTCS